MIGKQNLRIQKRVLTSQPINRRAIYTEQVSKLLVLLCDILRYGIGPFQPVGARFKQLHFAQISMQKVILRFDSFLVRIKSLKSATNIRQRYSLPFNIDKTGRLLNDGGHRQSLLETNKLLQISIEIDVIEAAVKRILCKYLDQGALLIVSSTPRDKLTKAQKKRIQIVDAREELGNVWRATPRSTRSRRARPGASYSMQGVAGFRDQSCGGSATWVPTKGAICYFGRSKERRSGRSPLIGFLRLRDSSSAMSNYASSNATSPNKR